jgi:hypothetical protein
VKINFYEGKSGLLAEVNSDNYIIENTQDALDLMANLDCKGSK